MGVCGECLGGSGTKYAVSHGVTADYFISGEPSQSYIWVKHAGSILVKIHVVGRSKHFCNLPRSQGVSAMEKMVKVIAAFEMPHWTRCSFEN